MKMTKEIQNISIHVAKQFLPQKFSTEEKVFAEIIRLSRNSKELNSIKLYHTLPDLLIISKDAYRKSIAYLKKKELIEKNGQKITLKNKALSEINQITIKQS